MKKLELNGYIADNDYAWEDDLSPKSVHAALYDDGTTDDCEILLESFGGDVNAAVKIFDDIKAYPGSVSIIISGTAASAGTIVAMAADSLTMTPGSLFMIHDPVMLAIGNESDLQAALKSLQACKAGIINTYKTRCPLPESEIAALMTATTWMDAKEAAEKGFVDAIAGEGPTNRIADRADAERRVSLYADRYRPKRTEKPVDNPVENVQKVKKQPFVRL